MKKISIVLAILAVFLVFSCSNAAGAVDVAGNPVDLAGSWSGSVAYKSALNYDVPAAVVVNGSSYTDYVGTWDKIEAVTKPEADYDEVSNYTYTFGGTTTTTKSTTKNVFYTPTKTVTVSRVIAEDGSYVDTMVTKYEFAAKAAIDPVAGTTYKVTGMFNSIDNFTATNERTYTYDSDASGQIDGSAWEYNGREYSKIPAELAGVYTETITTTVSFVKKDKDTFAKTSTTKTDYAYSGDRFDSTKNTSTWIPANKTVTGESTTVYKSAMDFIPSDQYAQTKKSGKKPVEYFNDITETLTLEVAKDGTYTLKSVAVETQAAAAAAAATDTAYAAAERKAATKTYTTTTKGTVASWETTTSEAGNVLKVAFSSNASTTEVVGTENFKDNSKTTTVTKLLAGTYNGRILKGESKDKEVAAKTRLYLDVTLGTDPDGSALKSVIIFDKAPEAAK